MTRCQCQVCGVADVEMYDICWMCGWQNDDSLEDGTLQDGSGNLVPVGFVLTPGEWNMGSWANHTTPQQHWNDWNPFTSKAG